MRKTFLNLLLIGGFILTITSCNQNSSNTDTTTTTASKGIFKDNRDSKEYGWVSIGDQVWMTEDLAYKTDTGCWEYKDDNASGYIYTWQSAKKAIPSGWHLPTDEEWSQLTTYLADNGCSYDNVIGNNYTAKSMSSNSGWDSSNTQGAIGNTDNPQFINKSGFSASPSATRFNDKSSLNSIGESIYWWTNSETHPDYAYARFMYSDNIEIYHLYYRKTIGFAVRCIRD